MIVNKTKTKVICFGRPIKCNVQFNGKIIEQIESYKYLGNVIRSVQRCDQDVYSANYHYLCDQSRKVIFSINRKLKCLRTLPATVMFYLFDALIRPILTYGSDVWGYSKAGVQVLDILFLNYIRCALQIKTTTCNPIVYGDCGRFPPSIYCHINVLCYYHRLLMMSGDVDERVSLLCNVVYDEMHFVTNCCINEKERLVLYRKLDTTDLEFTLLSDRDKFVYLMGTEMKML